MQDKMISVDMVDRMLYRIQKEPEYLLEAIALVRGKIIMPRRASIRARVATFFIQKVWRNGHGPLSEKMRLAKPVRSDVLRKRILFRLFLNETFSRFMPYRLLNGYRWWR